MTMALSTSMPMAMISAPSDTRCMVMPNTFISSSVPSTVNSSEPPATTPPRQPMARHSTRMTMAMELARLMMKPLTASSTTVCCS